MSTPVEVAFPARGILGPIDPAGAGRLTAALRAARLVVMGLLLLSAVSSWIAEAAGLTGLGPTGPVAVAQVCLNLLACAAALWERRGIAVALAIPLGVLALTVQTTGTETDVVVLLCGSIALRSPRRTVLLTAAGMVAYAVATGLVGERAIPGYGVEAALLVLGFAGLGLAVGLVARALLAAAQRRRADLRRLAAALPGIRSREREHLARELRAVMSEGLAAVERDTAAALRSPTDPAQLRRALDAVDTRSRVLLEQLRSLLGVLRQSADPAPDPGPDGAIAAAELPPAGRTERRTAPRLRGRLTPRHGRWALDGASVLVGLIAAGAAVDAALTPEITDAVIVLGWLAWALVYRSVPVAVLLAGAALAVALLPAGHTHWVLVPGALLALVGGLRVEPRRAWLIVVALVGYTAVLTRTAPSDGQLYIFLLPTVAIAMLGLGTVLRHVVTARTASGVQRRELARARLDVLEQERTAVARDLHDVVARHLSLTTLQIMATSGSQDPQVLLATVHQVVANAARARGELGSLISEMLAAGADLDDPRSPTSPLELARQLTEELAAQAFHPEFTISPGVARLDPLTRRTVVRVMQEASTNILRHAPRGSVCRFTVGQGADRLRLRVDNDLAGSRGHHVGTSRLSLGWGLLGLRERVDLLGGTFSAGPRAGRWVVEVDLPLEAGLSPGTARGAAWS